MWNALISCPCVTEFLIVLMAPMSPMNFVAHTAVMMGFSVVLMVDALSVSLCVMAAMTVDTLTTLMNSTAPTVMLGISGVTPLASVWSHILSVMVVETVQIIQMNRIVYAMTSRSLLMPEAHTTGCHRTVWGRVSC